jgi:hypothetical protein
MCIGFLAVTKKGQDLTRAGEKDDLHEIFVEQRKEMERRYREEAKKRADESRGRGKVKRRQPRSG